MEGFGHNPSRSELSIMSHDYERRKISIFHIAAKERRYAFSSKIGEAVLFAYDIHFFIRSHAGRQCKRFFNLIYLRKRRNL